MQGDSRSAFQPPNATDSGLAFVGVVFIVLAGCGGTSDTSATGEGGASGSDASQGTDGKLTPGSDSGASDTGRETASDGRATGDGGPDSGSSQGDSGIAPGSHDPSVYQHHKNGTRDGVYIEPVFTKTAAATTHVLPGFMGTVSADVYAQPLYVENGPGGAPAFIVATETNHVTALNASTGAVLWDTGPTTIGAAVTGGLSCGNINPLGITGTPFIDMGSGQGVVYFDAMTQPSTGTAKHLVYAVGVADGKVLPNWPVDVTAKVSGFNSQYQNQRGALQFVNGLLYVPYGGLDGDCGSYYGWVVGFPAASPQSPTGWHTAASRGGIWGPGALPTDGTSVFPITGNTSAGTAWGGGEAVIRLAAGPTFSGNAADYYAPANWKALDNGDTDLGGASEVLFDMPGAPTPHLIAAGGKDSNLYLLNRDNLGGIGGELLKQSVGTNEIKGAPAVYTTSQGTYVAFHIEGGSGRTCPTAARGNLVVMKITAGASAGMFTATTAWCSSDSGLGSPMVTTTDGMSNAIVWAANNHLWAYDGVTGAKLFTAANTAMGSSVQGWNTPIAASGHIAVGVNGQLYLFSP